MRITDIGMTKHGNVAVSVDGEYLFTATPDAWVRADLSPGDEITGEQIETLSHDTACDRARKKALSMLSARAYTKKQLTDRLARTHGGEAADSAVESMCDWGLIDDADYAERYARELLETRGYAPRRIRYELQKRGISRADIDAALEKLEDTDETGEAVRLLERKYHMLATDADVRRAAALLGRCGYSGDVIRTAIHAVRRLGNEDSI